MTLITAGLRLLFLRPVKMFVGTYMKEVYHNYFLCMKECPQCQTYNMRFKVKEVTNPMGPVLYI
jgi:hypothetical protein